MVVRSSNLRKIESHMLSFFFKITQFFKLKKKEIILLTGLNFSFSDLICFNLKFDILQSKIGYELTTL